MYRPSFAFANSYSNGYADRYTTCESNPNPNSDLNTTFDSNTNSDHYTFAYCGPAVEYLNPAAG
jgi:hypothetical protein